MNRSSNWQSVGVWASGAKLRSGFCRLKSCIKAFRHRRGVNLWVRFRRNLWSRFANPPLFFARKSPFSYMILGKSAAFLIPRLSAGIRTFWGDLSLDASNARISSRKSGRRVLRAPLNTWRPTLFRRAGNNLGRKFERRILRKGRRLRVFGSSLEPDYSERFFRRRQATNATKAPSSPALQSTIVCSVPLRK
jgi:hypothetical protein